MSLPRVHKNTQLAWADLAIFAGVLAFLGYSIQVYVVSSRRNVPVQKTSAEAVVAAQAAQAAPGRSPQTSSRTPASLAGKTTGSTEILRLPCLHNPATQTFPSDARLMQIHAPFCNDDARQTGQWKARNETSGEEILVFVNRKEKTFSTNYFSLKDGSNKIVFVLDLGKGQSRVENLEVKRSPRNE